MNLFDILGPIMVGPSSSHTAGAVRIGYIAGKLLGEPVAEANIGLHGSFASTGKGHGTDRALVAGLLGMQPDDERIPDSFMVARQEGMKFHMEEVYLKDVHPNSAKISLTGIHGASIELIASSLGGGRIRVCQMNGLDVNFSGVMPTLIVHNEDRPGCVTKVSSLLAEEGVNIGTMQLYRDSRGGTAVMVLECDQEISKDFLKKLENEPGILKTTYLSLEER